MKQHIITSVFLSTAILLLCGCSKDEVSTYQTDYSTAFFKSNVVDYSFIDTPEATSADVEVTVSVIGKISDKARTIAYEIDTENTTASNSQYEIVSATVPAGATQGAITVRVKNDPTLADGGSLKLALRILSNADFAGVLDENTKTAIGPISGVPVYLNTVLSWSNEIKMPEYWLKGGYGKYVSYTSIYVDAAGNVYGEQDATGSRKMISSKYRTNGMYSKALGKILREIWPEFININGYLGRDEATLEKYPMVTATSAYSVVLVHALESYVATYNAAHPGAPLRHSDDAACYTTTGAIATFTSAGVKYTLQFKENPPIKINPYAGSYGY